MRSPKGLVLAALPLALIACQPAAGPAPAPGPVAGPTAMASGNAAATNAVAPPPPVLQLRGTAAFAGAVALTAGGETTIEPRGAFRVELPIAIADARLSLLDAGDAMVPSSGSRLVGQSTVLTLTPAAALTAGGRFRLRLDGIATRELHAGDGRRFEPVEWTLVVAGEPAPRKAPVRKGTRR